jgi:hypothetical protein
LKNFSGGTNFMRKVVFFAALAVIILMTAGCASVNYPLLIGDGTVGPRTGQATGRIILGMFGDVDAGMITAARNAGITRIGAVDYRVKYFLGPVLVTYTTTVTGQ